MHYWVDFSLVALVWIGGGLYALTVGHGHKSAMIAATLTAFVSGLILGHWI